MVKLNTKRDRYNPISISNFYGSNYIAQKFIKISKSRNIINRYWSHGWASEALNFHPDRIATEPITNRCYPILVARSDQSDCLAKLGYKSKAIGLPYCYVEQRNYKRVRETLLVMPGHATKSITIELNSDYKSFIDYVLTQKKYFKYIAVCMHMDDIELGYHKKWEDVGINVIYGASVDDKNALERMYEIFSKFSVVLSDDLGSHVVYAAATGAKIAMRTPVGWVRDRSQNDFYKEDKSRLLPKELEKKASKSWKEDYEFLFCDPVDAKTHVDWGREQIGFDNRLTAPELKGVLGWSSPGFEYEFLIYNKNRIVNKLRRISNIFSVKNQQCT